MTKPGNHIFGDNIPANRVIPVLVPVIFLTFGMSYSGYGSDIEDSLLIERLYKLSISEKQIVIDSLIRSDLNEVFRLEKSAKFREAGSPLICKRIWPERFVNADMQSKTLVIDSMFADQSINFDFIGDILSTDKYRNHFPSVDDFMLYRTKLALKTGRLHGYHRARRVLLEYYHGGNKSRIFERPSRQDLLSDGGEYIAKTKDSSGINWAITYSWYYPDCFCSIWMSKKEPESDLWEGPWFTGVCIQIPQDSISFLRFLGNEPYLIDIKKDMYQLVSSRYLTKDLDNDGFYDIEETAFGTDFRKYDTDGDGLRDGIDINPLAPGIKNPSDRDLAVRAVVKLFTYHRYALNVYILSGDVNPDMEYFTNSPDPMFLTRNTRWDKWHFEEQPGAIPIYINVLKERDSLMVISAESKEEEYLYRLENNRGDWIITLGGPKHPSKNTIVGFNGNIFDP
ncbi:MAG: hypothetical protein JSW64_12160 [Candidatus Zixiibacteriota bacterium]|nr:MAG: hypothetical protein JSW64_12160 [candidate division Zixibacteria bacterium]